MILKKKESPVPKRHAEGWSRREVLGGLILAGAAGFLGLKPNPVAAEPPPETTTLRLAQSPGDLCQAPQYVAEQFLRDEGFTEVQYVKKEKDGIRGSEIALASGEANINMCFVPAAVIRLDSGDPIVILAGGHIGCFELLGTDQVRAIRDLKGKTVAVPDLRTGEITFIASMAAYVGLAHEDINWVTHPRAESMQLLAEGKIDAFMVAPPEQQNYGKSRSSMYTLYSTEPSTGLGRSISVAWWPGTGSSCGSIRWLRSGRCGQS